MWKTQISPMPAVAVLGRVYLDVDNSMPPWMPFCLL